MTKTKRTFPRITADCHEKLTLIAKNRGQNVSELTRDLYKSLIEQEFALNQKPAA